MAASYDTTIRANERDDIFMLGTRDVALPLRKAVEEALDRGESTVCVDFADVLVSHSFMDEFLGGLILRRGPSVLDRVILRNCAADVKAAARFVVSVRSSHYANEHASEQVN
jgi:hypothetical protein